jgi:NhaP-type Na+/H+ or K+/H+ antiporter
LYGLSGFVVGAVIAGSQIQAIDWASLVILYIWINIVRFIMVLTFYPALKHTGYGFSLKESLLLSFGGLRGAVGLTLALYIKSQLTNLGDKRSAALVEFFMAGSILFMMINGITAPFLLKRLKLDTKPNDSLMEALQQKMAEECTDALTSAGVDRRLAHYLGK